MRVVMMMMMMSVGCVWVEDRDGYGRLGGGG